MKIHPKHLDIPSCLDLLEWKYKMVRMDSVQNSTVDTIPFRFPNGNVKRKVKFVLENFSERIPYVYI